MDGTDARELSEAEMLGRRQIARRRRLPAEVPGFENSYIVDIAPQVGIRETRRVQGRYVLTEADVLECASFDDTIGVNGWPLELHLKGDVEFRWPKIPESRGFNHLPYRMTVPHGLGQPLGRRPLRFHEPRGAIGGPGHRRLLRDGPGRGHCSPSRAAMPAATLPMSISLPCKLVLNATAPTWAEAGRPRKETFMNAPHPTAPLREQLYRDMDPHQPDPAVGSAACAGAAAACHPLRARAVEVRRGAALPDAGRRSHHGAKKRCAAC